MRGKSYTLFSLTYPWVSKRELEYLREIVGAAHRPRIGRDRTGAIVLACELPDPVPPYADIAEPNRQAQRPHEIADHVAGPRAGASEFLRDGLLTLSIDGLVPLERGGKGDAGRDAVWGARVGPEYVADAVARAVRHAGCGGDLCEPRRKLALEARLQVVGARLDRRQVAGEHRHR